MIPKKLIVFGLLVFAGLAYLLKDQGLDKLQSKDVQQRLETSKKMKEKRALEAQGITEEQAKKQKLQEEADKRGYRFLPGQCITNRKDGWEFTKILGIGDRTYKIIDCHKYKGCTEQKELSWTDIEFEYRSGRIIPCSR